MHLKITNNVLTVFILSTCSLTSAGPVVGNAARQASNYTPFPYSPTDKSLSLSSTVFIRVEGPESTVFDGIVTSGPRNITATPQGESGLITFYCDGTNREANPKPGNTCVDALDAASKAHDFTYEAIYDNDYQDVYFNSIGNIPGTNQGYWGLLWNYQVPQYGIGMTLSGCQQEVQTGDEVLYAFLSDSNSQNTQYLKVLPRKFNVEKGGEYAVKVVNGMNGSVVAGAVIDGATTNDDGIAVLKFPHTGTYKYKATKVGNYVRSEQVTATVSE